MGDEYLVCLDDEFGLVTRLEARVGGDVVDVTELIDLRCGQALPGELFADPPEHRRRRTVHEAYAAEEESVSLAEAIRRAGFTVVVPAGLSCETFPVLVVLRHCEAGSTTVCITYRRPGGRAFAIHQGPSADSVVSGVSQWQPKGGHPPRWVETSPVGSTPRVALLTESSGTAAMISSDAREDLAALARSLVPAAAGDAEQEPE